MGTTLHGIVECYCEKTNYSFAHWEDFASIEFNKYYRLQAALGAMNERQRNWLLPQFMRETFIDSTTTTRHREADIGHNAGWVTLDELRAIADKFESTDEPASCTLLATIAFMRAMEKTYPKVRLIYYHM